MKGMSMVRSSNRFLLTLFLAGIAIGCTRKADTGEALGCDESGLIFKTVLQNPELQNYVKEYFLDSGKPILVWDDAPSGIEICETKLLPFDLKGSSSLIVDQDSKYVVVTKMYYDNSAAFVQLLFLPSGKNGEFFLRDENGWRIVRQKLWESRSGPGV